MAPSNDLASRSAWRLARRQLWVVSGDQLRSLGFTPDAIRHRVERGRLHRLWRDVFLVGHGDPTREQQWMAATLAAGEGAVLSHLSAAALWGIHPTGRRLATAGASPVHVTVPADRRVRLPGIHPHRRKRMPAATTKGPIPTTQPLFTLVDLAAVLGARQLEAAVNEADKLGLIRPTQAAGALAAMPRRTGIHRLERILGTQRRTDSDLERDFLRLVRKARLPEPRTQRSLNGHRVDFHWPEQRLVVEVDGSGYHRTPTQLTRDRRRDQAHLKAGLTPLRFTEIQIDEHPEEVLAMLAAVGIASR